jgi:putative membrane protein
MLNAGYYGMMGYGWGWGGMVLGLLFFIALIVLVVFAIRATIRLGPAKRDTENALEILKRRYARGEINKNDFEAMKKDLSA